MLQKEWNGHMISVKGNWTARWLWLAPEYELWLDEERLDRAGGPRIHPRLEAMVEDEEGELHHIEADILSLVGFRPSCELTVEGELIANDNIRVENFLNPFLILVIMVSTVVMLYVGPTVLRQYLH